MNLNPQVQSCEDQGWLMGEASWRTLCQLCLLLCMHHNWSKKRPTGLLCRGHRIFLAFNRSSLACLLFFLCLAFPTSHCQDELNEALADSSDFCTQLSIQKQVALQQRTNDAVVCMSHKDSSFSCKGGRRSTTVTKRNQSQNRDQNHLCLVKLKKAEMQLEINFPLWTSINSGTWHKHI